ncbi:hypothetical protein [Chitinophaga sp.]|uniref:hypothetical protein n=1 Tax=Chitinophaga sp. TaxID=1869181 RepID=UPI002F949AA3
MATLFIDYQQLVMHAYEQKKVNNALPHGLTHLTPAKLKDECVKRCTKEVSRRDEKVIRDFCGDLNESRNYYTILQRCDTDKFRPLVNYLKGKSENTEEKNIELLAWLIDFPDRPWKIGKQISGDGDINEELLLNEAAPVTGDQTIVRSPATFLLAAGSGEPIETQVTPGIPGEKSGGNKTGNPGDQKISRKSTKTLVAAVMLSLVLGTGSTWWWKEKNHTGDCMYWREDHYEPIACNEKIPNTVIIALDAIKLKSFRKITRPDTISYQAIGKVWYSKIDTNMEYFTSPGEHPVIYGRQLKPITAYIIDKHIKHILTGGITK